MEQLAVMITAYSLYEFVIRRFKKLNERTYLQAGIMHIIILLGTIGCLKISVWIGYVVLTLTSFLFDRLWKQPKSGKDEKGLERFFIRQFLMLTGLYIIWKTTSPMELQPMYIEFQELVIGKDSTIGIWLNQHFINMLFILSAFFFMIDGGTKIVRGVLDKFGVLAQKAIESLEENTIREKIVVTATKAATELAAADQNASIDTVVKVAIATTSAVMQTKNDPENESQMKAGEWIGILERIITLVFVFTGSYTAIAFALTAKSIARFKELENKDFAEYYLLGTSTSLVVAILTGIIVKTILGF